MRNIVSPKLQALLDTAKGFACDKTKIDFGAALLLATGVLVVYIRTLVPSVLAGDQGEFQYMPKILGIMHPSGFPLYLIVGFFVSLLPFGSLAFRMNLLSAIAAAAAIGLLYFALRRQRLHRLGAFGAALMVAFTPAFWRSANRAAVDGLSILCVVLFFLLLFEWESSGHARWLWRAMVAWGLGLAIHPTLALLAPATGLLVVLIAGRKLLLGLKTYLVAGACVVVPVIVLYGFLFVRGALALSNETIVPGLPVAMSRGLISPFFKPDVSGFVQYLSGQSFFHSFESGWDVAKILSNWLTLVDQTIGFPLFLLGLIGSMFLLATRPRVFAWVAVSFLTVVLVAIKYNQELVEINQEITGINRYLLVAFAAYAIPTAGGIHVLAQWLPDQIVERKAVASRFWRAGLVAAILFLVTLALVNEASRYNAAPEIKDSLDLQTKWSSIRNYAPEENTALLGHWGDLTPLWYYQYADGWRRDLVGIFPPSYENVDAWMKTGKPLYLVGSLLEWAPDLHTRYQMIPWGDIIRIAPPGWSPQFSPLHPTDVIFELGGSQVRLLGYDLARTETQVGETIDLATYWEATSDLVLNDVVLYVTMVNATRDSTRTSFPLTVNWLPGGKLKAGQHALCQYHYQIPWGTLPGRYDLALSLYSVAQARLYQAGGSDMPASATLAAISIGRAAHYPDKAAIAQPVNADFGHRVMLLGWEGDIKQITPGDTLRVESLWKRVAATNGLSMTWSLENATSTWQLGDEVLVPKYPIENWRDGEIVRHARSFITPANLPDGDYKLILRVRELAGRMPLAVYDGWLPRGDALTVTRVQVAGRSHAYALPHVQHPQNAEFGQQIGLLGYDLDKNSASPGQMVNLTLYWQAKSLMNTSYTVFVHVVNSQGKIVAQQDSVPDRGTLPTSGWLPNEVITDRYELPLASELAEGEYTIEIGLYDSQTDKRLSVSGSGSPMEQDRVVLDEPLSIK
jgi:4-amino-4-deoxy-L-arabinose transferase-like glycosyltransferase